MACYVQLVTLELGPDDKRMRLRYAGTCRLCGRTHAAGADAIYERSLKSIRCVECEAPAGEVSDGIAGASARREYERRKDAREQRIRRDRPKLVWALCRRRSLSRHEQLFARTRRSSSRPLRFTRTAVGG